VLGTKKCLLSFRMAKIPVGADPRGDPTRVSRGRGPKITRGGVEAGPRIVNGAGTGMIFTPRDTMEARKCTRPIKQSAQ
jgi:hypothetical protein